MRIQLRGHQIDWTAPLRRHAERRLHLALSRLSQCIGLVTVDIHHNAGASAGLQMGCRITVNLLPKGRILVEDVQEDLYAAISRLADQTGRAAGRALERERDWAAGLAPSKDGGRSKP
ncbi:MAG: HPF/RaiA family ribosome-associated protein [Acidobacteria bacterium]|nr:HPF/RaiA family ribosome-associated protein [Acidobacteriota bacterium]